MINFTFGNITKPYQPDEQAFEWCLNQKVIGYHNIEIYSVMLIAGSLVCIIAFEFLREKHFSIAMKVLFFAKLSIYMFFIMYFLHLSVGV